jgi:hypothetical protein
MTMGRYVLLVLARPGSSWVTSLQQRIAAGSLGAQLVMCAGPEEAHVRLASGRLHSAVLIDPSFPRDVHVALVAAAEAAGIPVIEMQELAGGLATRAQPVPWGDRLPASVAMLLGTAMEVPVPQGTLVGVCGPGGTGVSVVAMALAQGMADWEDVLLADFALRAHQALLHRVPDVAGGLLDFVARQRRQPLAHAEVRAGTVPIAGQRYRLLPGLLRAGHWVAVRPRAFDATLGALRSAFGLVIADIRGEFEGEADSGRFEIEERHHMARRVAAEADLVVVVGGEGRTTRHAVAEMVEELRALGVDERRILAVVNRASSRCLRLGNETLALPEVVLDGGATLPADLVRPLGEAVMAALLPLPSTTPGVALRPVVPGTLGCWGGSG